MLLAGARELVSMPRPEGGEMFIWSVDDVVTGVLNQSSETCCSSGGESSATSWARGAVAPLAARDIPSSRVANDAGDGKIDAPASSLLS